MWVLQDGKEKKATEDMKGFKEEEDTGEAGGGNPRGTGTYTPRVI